MLPRDKDADASLPASASKLCDSKQCKTSDGLPLLTVLIKN